MVANDNCIRIERFQEQNRIYDAMRQLKKDFYSDAIDIVRFSEKIAKNGEFLAAFFDNVLAGFIGYYANDYEKKAAFITTIVVSRAFQKQGVGKALLFACLKDCCQKGMNRCLLEVNKHNSNASDFYIHMGFIKERESTEDTVFYSISV